MGQADGGLETKRQRETVGQCMNEQDDSRGKCAGNIGSKTKKIGEKEEMKKERKKERKNRLRQRGEQIGREDSVTLLQMDNPDRLGGKREGVGEQRQSCREETGIEGFGWDWF